MQSLKITANLISPLAGDAPMLDALLEKYAFSNNINNCAKLSKGMQLNKHDKLTYYMLEHVPLGEYTFKNGKRCYAVSSPIVDCVSDGVEHMSTRMDFNVLKDVVSQNDINKLAPVTGPYHPSFEPFRVRNVRKICWYANGHKRVLREWLKDIKQVGGYRAAGFGMVSGWDVEESGEYWLLAQNVLMRPVPVDEFDAETIYGAKMYYGAIVPPYWHPQRHMEILTPC